MTRASYIHVQSMRLASGHEALIARVLTDAGGVGYGFSFRLDAAEARHMAEWHAGVRKEGPRCEPVLAHPWETAYVAGEPIPWDYEPGFTALEFSPPPPPGSSASTRR
jgi:hypothetical protein